ncbi:MAG: alpha/beta fold hydrolase [Rhizobiaceae bacterium]
MLAIVGWVVLAAVLAVAAVVVAYVWRTQRIAREAERLVPVAGKFVTIDGNRIHYVERGIGPPILFIHGLGAQLHQFTATLFPKLDGFRLVAIDRPGAGYSTRASGASGKPTEQARIIAGVIDALKLGKPLVVGHSLGGAVALALALDHPDKVAGLALLSPHTKHRDSVPPEFAALHIPSRFKRWALSHTVAVPASQKFAAATMAYVFAPQTAPDDYMTKGGGSLGLRPAHFHGSATDITDLAQDYPALAARYGELKMPVGILYGTADKLLDHKANGIGMAEQIPGLELELLDGVGHMPHFVAADASAAFIRRIAAKAFG